MVAPGRALSRGLLQERPPSPSVFFEPAADAVRSRSDAEPLVPRFDAPHACAAARPDSGGAVAGRDRDCARHRDGVRCPRAPRPCGVRQRDCIRSADRSRRLAVAGRYRMVLREGLLLPRLRMRHPRWQLGRRPMQLCDRSGPLVRRRFSRHHRHEGRARLLDLYDPEPANGVLRLSARRWRW